MSRDVHIDYAVDSSQATAVLRDAIERMSAVITVHLAMTYVDHDGGDECDELVKARQFIRAARHPRARVFSEGRRLFVVREPELRPLAPTFTCTDPGDKQ